ncbi:Hsp20 family protein [Texas Phoenix palm phytoplasma]|uniref:Hsp20 family protein n=1 Tax=Texas Phoenix palm phytoplasma TaxID=176709 RepID=A0ABS5BIX8_9MOLU|nr:Hsp20 family protein [Texas Phoenix palm phytoplasma]MBP3059543.1 Hsp20 family protein [Texas Phoenix palm phytoplasma]
MTLQLPFFLLDNQKDLIENFFEDLQNNHFSNQNYMKTDIKEFDNYYAILIDVPGFKKENIKISLNGKWLNIETQLPKEKEEKEKEKFRYLKKERMQGIAKRSFNLGEEFSINDLKGHVEDGLLVLTINKKTKNIKPKEEYLELK